MTGRHFLHVFPSFDPGGMEVRATTLMDRLAPPDRHTVVSMSGRISAAERVQRARLDLLPAPPRGSFAATGRRMAARLRALRPDLVLTYNWGSIESVLGARWAGQRALIHHEEGFGVDEAVRLKRRRMWVRRALLPRAAAAVVVPSMLLRGVACQRWRLPEVLVRYLPNGVDLELFHPAPRREAEGAAAGGPVVVGSVARLRPEKNLGALVEAFARCRQRARAELVLVGDGPQRESLERAAQECGVGDRVRFAGHLGDPAPTYRSFDVFAMSSRTEQMPLVVLEAMACGLPVVATDVGDIRHMVAEANRDLLVPDGDRAALAAALDRAIESAALRGELGAANRAVCEERYALDECLAAHLELYDRVIGSSGLAR